MAKITGILPEGNGETRGYLPKKENWVPSTSFYLPIGQGFSVTPIQLLRAGASIANGGKLLRPYLAWKLLDSETSEEIGENQSYAETSPFSQ